MTKKMIFLLFFLLNCQPIFATTCPTIKDIKQSALNGWKIYDADNGKPLSDKRLAQFKQLAHQFALAEWSTEHNSSGRVLCYYHDSKGADLEAYLAKEHFLPENANNAWYPVTGSMHCAAGTSACTFKVETSPKKQLAKG